MDSSKLVLVEVLVFFLALLLSNLTCFPLMTGLTFAATPKKIKPMSTNLMKLSSIIDQNYTHKKYNWIPILVL